MQDRQILSCLKAEVDLRRCVKGTGVNFGDMKTRGFVPFCLNRKRLIIQNADPAQAFLS